MREIQDVAGVREAVARARRAGARIGFVPTMGNLHAGHLALVNRARAVADQVVVSIFVNPLQFSAGEDFGRYPRTLEADRERLAGAGAHLLFVPAAEALYGRDLSEVTRVEVPRLGDMLCGAFRPGHFAGVATVVNILFNIVQPDLAVFGEKDFQQLQVIRRMVDDLRIPVEILGVATVREADGLAMSSRNGYLSAADRRRAPALYRALCAARARLQAGAGDLAAVEATALESLTDAGFTPEYFTARRRTDLAPATPADTDLVILAAARLGGTRLIDNVAVDLGERAGGS